MGCEELRHDLCMVTFSTDHVVMMPKYHGKILVGDDRRGTGIIHKTCEAGNIGTMNRDCTGSELKCGFNDFFFIYINKFITSLTDVEFMEHTRQVLIRIILAIFVILILVQVSCAADLEPPLKVAWKYRLGAADVYGHNPTQSIELIIGDVVYAKYGNRLVALDADNGKLLWDKDWNGGLAYKNDVLYVARSHSTSLYALDPVTGKEIWIKEYSELDAESKYDLVIFEDVLCILTKEKSRNLRILAVDTNGNFKWHHGYTGSPDVFKRPTVSSNLMVISLSKNKLIAIDIITGETIWQIKDIDFNGNIHAYKDLFFIENLRENGLFGNSREIDLHDKSSK